MNPWPLPRSILLLDHARIHCYPQLFEDAAALPAEDDKAEEQVTSSLGWKVVIEKETYKENIANSSAA